MLQPRTRISHRFFLAIMVIVVIPIAIMGYESTIVTKRTLTAFAFQHMATLAETRANHLDSWLEERLDDVGVLSRLPAIREACQRFYSQAVRPSEPPSDLLKDTLNIIEERSPSYENIYILLPDGEVLASTHAERADEAVFRGLEVLQRLEGSEEPVLSPVYQYGDVAGWHLQIAARIDGQEDKPLAFIVAVLDLSKTIDPIMVERTGLGETGETYLVNRDRRIISESRYLAWEEIVDRQFETRGIRAVLDEKSGTAIYESYTGREVLGSYVWLPRYEWGILAEMETDEILWPLQWIKTIGILTTLMVTLICLLMAYVVSRRVSMPIVQVADAAERMAQGDLFQKIPFSSQDEVGRLAQSFNAMAWRLSQSVASLRQKEESLQKAYNELIAAQEQLLHSERMAAIGELVASVAHEMRSPLSSIRLNLQIIGRSLSRDTVLHEHYEIAFDQVLQMERMFSDLLNFSKPVEIQRKDIRVEALLDRCLKELTGELTSRGIRVEQVIEPDLPPLIADPDKIEQVLGNVLKNAIEASPPGGRIQLACMAAEDGSRGGVTIAVTDHGAGISQRNLKLIFQPFFTTKKKGTGLGLSIVKKIMDAHRGVMLIESEEGRGTVVRLTFPGVRGIE